MSLMSLYCDAKICPVTYYPVLEHAVIWIPHLYSEGEVRLGQSEKMQDDFLNFIPQYNVIARSLVFKTCKF